ncbi:hypothetical protein D7X55_36225 [Corallococcus sp. AB049A]|uniref:hypothetical protein n=1 Tax=Corallococcus sp. AB049A TaxID=2316721 RepID=UPI000EE4B3D1|nr:hypothetical protein [Corallococcus sp. AB049A]RKI48616.1 hypothetical protein D7X55_36225 [Corallococcus sp. AB049A]
MQRIPLSEARSHLSALVQQAATQRHVTAITVHDELKAFLPRSFASAHAKALGLGLGLVLRPLPPVEMLLAWHLGHEGDPKHAWVRALVQDAVRAVGLA